MKRGIKCKGFLDVMVYDTKHKKTVARYRTTNHVVSQGLKFLAANLASPLENPAAAGFYDYIGAAAVGTNATATIDAHTNLLAVATGYRNVSTDQVFYINSGSARLQTMTNRGKAYQAQTAVVDNTYFVAWSYGGKDLYNTNNLNETLLIKEVGIFYLRALNYVTSGHAMTPNSAQMLARITIPTVTKTTDVEAFFTHMLVFN
jgi:hypothetical protein